MIGTHGRTTMVHSGTTGTEAGFGTHFLEFLVLLLGEDFLHLLVVLSTSLLHLLHAGFHLFTLLFGQFRTLVHALTIALRLSKARGTLSAKLSGSTGTTHARTASTHTWTSQHISIFFVEHCQVFRLLFVKS